MKHYWVGLSEKINALELRERGLVLLAAMAIIYLLWAALVDDSQNLKRQVLSGSIKKFETENKRLTTESQTLLALASGDPDARHNRALAQVKAQIDAIDNELEGLANGLVSAHQLPLLLQDVLLQSKTLTLVKLKTLAVEELKIPTLSEPLKKQKTPDNNAIDPMLLPESELAANSAGVYQHSVEITLKGDYFEVVAYLKALEALPWRFYWDWLDYDVERYPNAQMTLRVYTLTAEQGVLGV